MRFLGICSLYVSSERGLVDNEVLIDALISGHLAAAGLDVFESEPKVNPAYIALKNTSASYLDNIEAVLGGRLATS